MKKLMTLALLMLMIGFSSYAQEDNTAKSDTTKVKAGSVEVRIVGAGSDGEENADDEDDGPEAEDFRHWGGLDVGATMLLNADGGTGLPEDGKWLDLDEARSLTWSFNLIDFRIPIAQEYVGISSGLGLTYRSLGLTNNVTVLSNSDSTYAANVPDSLYTFDKNKLRGTYLRVPLLLEFNTSKNPDRNVHLSVGVIGGLRIGSITKQIYEVDGQKFTDRVKSDFNLTPFTADATVRIGYRDWSLWATYGLTPLFENGKGPEVYPLTVGIGLPLFD